jgi:hypothetical protein
VTCTTPKLTKTPSKGKVNGSHVRRNHARFGHTTCSTGVCAVNYGHWLVFLHIEAAMNLVVFGKQGRPFDNAYCVLSLFEREHGVRVAAYNSETLSETELLLPWDVVSANVGHVNSKTPMEVG